MVVTGDAQRRYADVTVLIPVLDRPDRVLPLLESLRASETEIQLDPVFLVSPGDTEETLAILNAGVMPRTVPWQPGTGDYAKKINLGFREAETDWVFLGADDLRFHPGWATAAIAAGKASGCCVVGTNDLGNQRTVKGIASTHSLVWGTYSECGTVDGDGDVILHEGYAHNFVDDEFVQTAMWRGTFAHAPRAIVEHLHPNWRKGTDDETYRKGQKEFVNDRGLYNRRRRLFDGEPR